MLLALLSVFAGSCPIQRQEIAGPARVVQKPAAPFHWESPGIFDEYLPWCDRLCESPSGLIAIGNGREFRLDDLARATADEPSKDKSIAVVLDVATQPDGLLRLVARKDGTAALESPTASRTIPGMRWDSDRDLRFNRPVLAANGAVMVVVDEGKIHRFQNGAWNSVALEVSGQPVEAWVSRAFLDGSTLYVGTDKGEWGGSLIAADVSTGKGTVVSAAWEDSSNVADIDRGPDGRIYVTTGCVHMDGWGALYVQDGASWRQLARTTSDYDGLRDVPRADWMAKLNERNRRGTEAWELPPTGFSALAFDAEGRPCLLCETFGLFRRESDGGWSWLTPGWPNFGADVTDLAIVGEKAVISARSAGVIVVDLETLAVERARLR